MDWICASHGNSNPPYLPYPIFYLLRASAHPGGPMSPDRVGAEDRILQMGDRGTVSALYPIFYLLSSARQRPGLTTRIHRPSYTYEHETDPLSSC